MTTKGFQIDHYQPHGNLNLVGCLALKYSQCSMRVSLINSKNVSFSLALQWRDEKSDMGATISSHFEWKAAIESVRTCDIYARFEAIGALHMQVLAIFLL